MPVETLPAPVSQVSNHSFIHVGRLSLIRKPDRPRGDLVKYDMEELDTYRLVSSF